MDQAKIRISQCMIVKNEEAHIRKALSWGKGVVYEQIVVDTGSTDRTVEIAREMGAKVFHFTWIDDFSAAKNYAIKQARGNWIAFLDADESIPEDEVGKLLPLLKKLNMNPEICVVRAKLVNVNDDGSISGFGVQDRFFRNDPKLRYRYRIHEQLHHKTRKIYAYDAQAQLTILHTGYGAHVNRPEKGIRNARMIERDLEERPNDALLHMYLGDAYNMANQEEKALECYRKVINDPAMQSDNESAFVRAGLQIFRLQYGFSTEKIQEEFHQVSEFLRNRGCKHPDIDYYMAILHVKKNQLQEAAILFEQALKKAETHDGNEVSSMAADLELPNRIIAMAAYSNSNYRKAVQFAVQALNIKKYSADALKVLLCCFRQEWKEGMDVAPYWHVLNRIYDETNLKDVILLYRFTTETGLTALAEYIFERIPTEIQQQVKDYMK